MSGVSTPAADPPLNLRKLPENFHPAAVWLRVVLMTLSFASIKLTKPIAYYLYELMGTFGVIITIMWILIYLFDFFFCVSGNVERWFPRPRSTRSWGGRAAIGWSIRRCQLDTDTMKYTLNWNFNISSIIMVVAIVGVISSENYLYILLFSCATAFAFNDDMRRLTDRMAKQDPRIAALIY